MPRNIVAALKGFAKRGGTRGYELRQNRQVFSRPFVPNGRVLVSRSVRQWLNIKQ
jgi:hypothetical protein